MKIVFSRKFKKIYIVRVLKNPKLEQKFKNRMRMFQNNPQHASLKLHKLTGSKYYYSYSVTGDVRVILTIKGDIATFHNVGTHSQVY